MRSTCRIARLLTRIRHTAWILGVSAPTWFESFNDFKLTFCVSFFRWRQAPFGQEQYHSGLNLPTGEADIACAEIAQLKEELEPLARFEDGQGALFSHDRFLYLAGLPDDRWLEDLVKMVTSKGNLPVMQLPHGVRSRRLGRLRCFFNYNPSTVQLPAFKGLDILVGSTDLPPAGVLVAREERLR